MKRILAVLALCSLGLALRAESHNAQDEAPQRKTKFICAIGGPVRTFTTEFATREECEKECQRPGIAAVCEETGIDTEIEQDI